jgi:hypothetical protein
VSGAGSTVELLAEPVDQAVRLRRRGDDDRADFMQRGGKGPVDEVVVGSRAGEQNGGDTAQIDRHHTIVPGRDISGAAGRPDVAYRHQQVYRGGWLSDSTVV